MIRDGTQSKYRTTTCRVLGSHSHISTSTSPFRHAFHIFINWHLHFPFLDISLESRWSRSCKNLWSDHNDVSRGRPVVSMIVTPSPDTSSRSVGSSSGSRGSRGSFAPSSSSFFFFFFSRQGAAREGGNLVERRRELAFRPNSSRCWHFPNVRASCPPWWRTGTTWSSGNSNVANRSHSGERPHQYRQCDFKFSKRKRSHTKNGQMPQWEKKISTLQASVLLTF